MAHLLAMKSKKMGRPVERISKKPLGKRVGALRRKGLTYREIGAILGFSKQRAHHICQRILAEQRT